jgi:hypothetical protein
MFWRIIFMVIPLVAYLIQGGICFWTNDRPHAMMWWCYGFANVSLIWYEVNRVVPQ